MMTWGDGQSLAICLSCRARLDAPASPSSFCSFYEVDPAVLRSAARSGTIPQRTDGLDGEKGAEGILGKMWGWLMDC